MKLWIDTWMLGAQTLASLLGVALAAIACEQLLEKLLGNPGVAWGEVAVPHGAAVLILAARVVLGHWAFG